ncbi:MAG: ferritin family protein [Calditrichaceae bacterium]|nr:ferritin family protein [Calditrichaceae bacterium]
MHTLKDFLNLAIDQEINAQKLYKHGASVAKDEKSRQFLNRLEREEIEHEKTLFNIRETGIFDLDIPIEDESVFDVALTSHGARPDMDENLTIEQVWEIALKREYMAQQRYLRAAKSVKDKELAELLNNLARDEEQHYKVVDQQFKMHTGSMREEF